VRTNSVTIGVTNDPLTVEGRLRQYGPEIVVRSAVEAVQDACMPTHCPKAKGGLELFHDLQNQCTAGPIGHRTSGALALLTAGHCFHFAGQSGDTWTHNGAAAGVSSGDTWINHAAADSGYLTLDSGFVPGADNEVIVLPNGPSGPDVVGHVVAYYLRWAQPVGGTVCRTGINSFRDSSFQHCGPILDNDATKRSCHTNPCPSTCPDPPNNQCVLIDHTVVVDFDSTKGDSGGPYYTLPSGTQNNVILFGTHIHSSVDGGPEHKSWYSPTNGILDAIYANLNNRLDWFCTTATCTQPSCGTTMCM
jgi:hypothetical protein